MDITKKRYWIREEETGNTLASNLTLQDMDQWWVDHEDYYFGLRIENEESETPTLVVSTY